MAAGSDPSAPLKVTLSVIDQNNHPVANATATVGPTEKPLVTVQSDASGKAVVQVPAPGTYTVNISKQGYLSADTTLDVSVTTALEPIEIVISSAALSQQSINVTGEPTNPVADTEPSSQTLPPAQAKNAPSNPATLNAALPLGAGYCAWAGRNGAHRGLRRRSQRTAD